MRDIQAAVHIDLPMEEIAKFCQRWQICELALFGSVLRDDFRPDSDIDVLVTFVPNARQGLFDKAAMEQELGRIFGRTVDLVYRRVIERDDNYLLRRSILGSAKAIYVA